MVPQVETAILCNRLQLMVGQLFTQLALCSPASAEEFITRIIHAVFAEHRLKAALVERTVMGNERKSLYFRLYLLPYVGEGQGVLDILHGETVHSRCEIGKEVGAGKYKAVETVGHDAVPHHHDSHAAHAGTVLVGCLKINSCKVVHVCFMYVMLQRYPYYQINY